MSYFRRIIDRTLGPIQPSVRPALTPDSIPESPAETKLSPASKKRKDGPSEMDVKGALAAMSASVKVDLPKEDTNEIETNTEPEKKPRESHVGALHIIEAQEPLPPADTSSNTQDISVTKQQQPVSPKLPPEQEEGSIVQAMINATAKRPDTESRPATEIRVHDDIINVAQSVRPISSGDSFKPVAGKEIRVHDDIINVAQSVRPISSGDSFKPVAGKEIREIQSLPEQHPAYLKEVALSQDVVVSSKGSRTGNDEQKKYRLHAPTAPIGAKYTSNISSLEEAGVTINIGRIEVKTEPAPAEPEKRPMHKFSPTLSLADYLKLRSEGKIG
jgi:hypothetical protein